MGISVATCTSMLFYFLCYYPETTQISISKSSNIIEVTYKMMSCNRQIQRQEQIDNVEEIEVKPVKSQYGIVGYVCNITFKDGAKTIQLYKDREDKDIVEDFEELSQFILGRNAKDNELKGNCECSCGDTYCVCCKNWGLILALFLFFALGYVALSFAIAYEMNDEKLFD